MTKRDEPSLSLSVALATYNGERYITEQLESIARQTRLPDELVVSDDASVDATRMIVQDFARRACFPVRLIENHKRIGSTRNFENAIRGCGGSIIFLCDQDDVWYPNKTRAIEGCFIDKPETDAVFTDADVVDENLRPLGQQLWRFFRFSSKEQAQVRAGDATEVLLKHPVATGATMAFRSTYRDLILPLPDTWHDAWIALLISATSFLDALPTPLIAYRQHQSNQLGIPRRGRNRTKTCAEIYGPQVFLYKAVLTRLLAFPDRYPASKQKIALLEDALVFSRSRAMLPEARWRRVPIAMRELLARRYHDYAFGLNSFRKDLMR